MANIIGALGAGLQGFVQGRQQRKAEEAQQELLRLRQLSILQQQQQLALQEKRLAAEVERTAVLNQQTQTNTRLAQEEADRRAALRTIPVETPAAALQERLGGAGDAISGEFNTGTGGMSPVGAEPQTVTQFVDPQEAQALAAYRDYVDQKETLATASVPLAEMAKKAGLEGVSADAIRLDVVRPSDVIGYIEAQERNNILRQTGAGQGAKPTETERYLSGLADLAASDPAEAVRQIDALLKESRAGEFNGQLRLLRARIVAQSDLPVGPAPDPLPPSTMSPVDLYMMQQLFGGRGGMDPAETVNQ